jgi:hypothetical protein
MPDAKKNYAGGWYARCVQRPVSKFPVQKQ